ncbi:TonB-dependent receptor [Novosphingobium profundi]|nr:TonB-dependent receptor [Novosphingobium profundi]MBT0670266.1 TonB-dependent receptor [Novosphingobium profundi]
MATSLATAAQAEDAAGAAPADAAPSADADAAGSKSGANVGSEIVVTSERTHTTLQKAALSVTAVTADSLAKSNITEIGGLNGLAPGLVVSGGNGGERNISIRGIGLQTPENPSTQPGVSYHVDGVYIFNSIAANAAFTDVGQIEVLRGPQGTMYGQGSTGGTINVVSNQPTTEKVSGYVDAGYGNYNYTKADGALNLPITNTLAVRGAIQYMKHDGYAHATDVPGKSNYELSDANNLSGKLAVKWAPTDRLSVLLSTIQYRGDANGQEQKNLLDSNPDPREVTQDYPGKSYVRTQLYYGVIKYDLGTVNFTSTTSYQKLLSRQSWDGDALNPELFVEYEGENTGDALYDHIAQWQQKVESYTQEYNLASDTEGPFSWIVGAVYLHSQNENYINEYSASTGDGQLAALAKDTAWNDDAVSSLYYGELTTITRESYAFYGQGSLNITDDLKLTAGLRYNHDTYNGAGDSINGGAVSFTSGNYLQPTPSVTDSTHEMTWKAALDYQITPSNMVYFSYTRGYKPGGVNVGASKNGSLVTFGNEYGVAGVLENEVVDSLEIGSKNRFFDDKLQINASGFYYFYKNLQFINDDPILFAYGLSNAPMAHIYGVELEAEYRPSWHWHFSGNVGLEKGTFDGDMMALDPRAATAAQVAAGYAGTSGFYSNYYNAYLARLSAYQNIDGNDVPNIPKVQGSFAGEWTGKIGPGDLLLRAQYIYRGSYWSSVFNNGSEQKTPSYDQVNLYANYDFADTGFSLSATVTNLFDTDGVSSRFTDPYGTHQIYDTYIPPRQFIATLRYDF